MLGVGVVHRNDRVGELAVLLQRSQTDNARGGLLCPAEHVRQRLAPRAVECRNHIGAVVHGDLRTVIDRSGDVPVVAGVIFALDGVDGHLVMRHEGRCDVILG